MCVAAGPAHFSDTILYHGRCRHPQHGLVHVLGYQNVAANQATGPNAMLLHLPGAGMTPGNFVDTGRSRDILTDMAEALTPRSAGYGGAPAAAGRAAPPPVQVFEHDIYTVVLATDATLIPDALSLVPEHRRVPVNRPLFDFYAREYPRHAVALCCFDNRDAARSDPLLLWYEPLRPDRVELPAIDCHTGDVPEIGAPVEVDHWVIFGSDEPAPFTWPWEPASMDWSEEVRQSPAGPFLPRAIVGRTFTGPHANGDFMISTADLDAGRTDQLQRVGPDGTPHRLPPAYAPIPKLRRPRGRPFGR
jgi:hypothetical protein